MLTGELIRVRVRGRNIEPSYIPTDHERNLERAETLLDLFRDSFTRHSSRQDISGKIKEMVSVEVEHKLLKGLAKLLMDRSEFHEPELPDGLELSPRQLRRELFLIAARQGPYSRRSDLTPPLSREEIFKELGGKYECAGAAIEDFMYSDLKEMHRITEFRDFASAEDLLHRYNVALVQACLLRATSVKIHLKNPPPKWLRYLFRMIKFNRLMFTIRKIEDDVELVIDGPQSLFKLSTKYGLQMANFFPSLLIQPNFWSLEAELLWGKKRKTKKKLFIDSSCEMKSHYKPNGVWRSNTEKWFEERFEAHDSEWSLSPGTVLPLSGQRILIPDFDLRRGSQCAHLEIVGFWRKNHLKTLLGECPPNVILAVSRRLAGEKSDIPNNIKNQILLFSEVISIPKLEEKLKNIFD